VELGLDLTQMRNRTLNAVNLCDYQNVALPGEVERGLKLRSIRVDARKVLAEYLLDACRPKNQYPLV